MTAFVARRVLTSLLTLLIVITISFAFIRATPGGPFDQEKAMAPEMLKRLEAKYNMDKPIMVQYGIYMKQLIIHQDLGVSTKYKNRTVNNILSHAFKVSMVLGGSALLFALVFGISSGVLSAVYKNRWEDYAISSLVILGVAIPNFILGPVLVIFFCFKLGWFPVAGWGTLKQLILPALTLGMIRASYISRMTRSGMVEVLRQDYIRTARSKGVSSVAVIWKHALKPGILPVLSYIGPATAGIFVGSVVIERIFNIPGMGTFLVNSATNRDLPVAMGAVIIYTTMLLMFNLLVDIAYTFVDPRIEVS